MKFNFDRLTDRRETNSLKWNVSDGELPMWVADMDFETAPAVKRAIEERASHGIFGYSDIPDKWYNAVGNWWKRRHNFKLEKSWLVFCSGVVPAISSIVRKLTSPAEKVLIQTPVYNIFFNCIVNNGSNIIENTLTYSGGQYEIDFDDLENKLADPQTRLMILCNPHNPVGKIWSREILSRIGELCAKYGVTVISDEIHCDITEPGSSYIPFASVSDLCANISITCIAPTKAFNIAGLQTSAVSVINPQLRHRVWRAINTDEVGEPNAFAVDAAVAAFTDGDEWLDELCRYISEGKQIVRSFLEKELPDIYLVPSQATYLLWLDCRDITDDSTELAEFIRAETGLYLSSGAQYGESGKNFLRMNIACPHERVYDGLTRLKTGVKLYVDKL